MDNTYCFEIVTRFNLDTPELPHLTLSEPIKTQFFLIYKAEVTSEYLGTTIARLDGYCDASKIVTYYFEQKRPESEVHNDL